MVMVALQKWSWWLFKNGHGGFLKLVMVLLQKRSWCLFRNGHGDFSKKKKSAGKSFASKGAKSFIKGLTLTEMGDKNKTCRVASPENEPILFKSQSDLCLIHF